MPQKYCLFIFYILNIQKDSNSSSDSHIDASKYNDDFDEDIDEAQSLAAKYVQRSPTVPIKVKKNL